MKYIFKQVDDISGHNAETTIEFSADTLPDVLEHFEMFIRGCGFHPSGTLEYVNEEELYEEDYYETFEPSEEEHKEPVQEEWPFALHKQPKPIYDGDLNSFSESVMDWTAAQLIRPPQMKGICPVCKIDNETMLKNECWDQNCPKGKDAN
jgi:hypothetical protein